MHYIFISSYALVGCCSHSDCESFVLFLRTDCTLKIYVYIVRVAASTPKLVPVCTVSS